MGLSLCEHCSQTKLPEHLYNRIVKEETTVFLCDCGTCNRYGRHYHFPTTNKQNQSSLEAIIEFLGEINDDTI